MHALSPTTRSEFVRGIRESGPLLIGLLPFALILGMQGGQKGMSWLEMLLMTGMHPLPIALIAGMTLMINSRHILMGAALAPYLRHLPMKKILPALFFMCDESWAMGMAEARKRRTLGLSAAFNLPYYAGVCFILYTTWISFAACGAALGPKLGDVAAWGFGMAFPAVFLVLIRGMWRGVRPALPWLVSLIVAAVVYRVFGGAWYVPAGAVVGLATAWLMGAEAEAA